MAGVQASRRTHVIGCGWFWAWALLGCAVALSAVSLGPILFLPVAVIAALMASRGNDPSFCVRPAQRRRGSTPLRRLGATCRAGHDLLAHRNGKWMRPALESLAMASDR